MNNDSLQVVVKRFDESPDEVREFEKGRFEVIHLGGMTIGRATYEPGWVWSKHAKPADGPATCPVEHVVLVLSGRCAVRMDDGEERVMTAGDLVYVPPGHESWVVGDEPYVSLHFMGADEYARK